MGTTAGRSRRDLDSEQLDFDGSQDPSGIHVSLRRRIACETPAAVRASFRVTGADWGGAQPEHVEAVARCAVEALSAGITADVKLLLTSTTGSPAALRRLSSRGEFIVQLSVQGPQWGQLSYQFAHEFCHVLADVTTWQNDGFAWLEESLCEMASLCALRSLARTWPTRPPQPEWRGYAPKLGKYADWRMYDQARTLPAGVSFCSWLAARLPLLQADAERRDDNTIVAKQLLPLFEARPAAWRALRYLHASVREEGTTLVAFLGSWRQACPADLQGVVERIAELLGVALVDPPPGYSLCDAAGFR
jgi:hypothetical protein